MKLSPVPPEISELANELRPLVEKAESITADELDDSEEDYNDADSDVAAVILSPGELQRNVAKDIHSYVSCLMRLIPSMEHTLNFHEDQDTASSPVEFHDLQRHHQSTHINQRNHQCNYCSKLFAREDALRRYKRTYFSLV